MKSRGQVNRGRKNHFHHQLLSCVISLVANAFASTRLFIFICFALFLLLLFENVEIAALMDKNRLTETDFPIDYSLPGTSGLSNKPSNNNALTGANVERRAHSFSVSGLRTPDESSFGRRSFTISEYTADQVMEALRRYGNLLGQSFLQYGSHPMADEELLYHQVSELTSPDRNPLAFAYASTRIFTNHLQSAYSSMEGGTSASSVNDVRNSEADSVTPDSSARWIELRSVKQATAQGETSSTNTSSNTVNDNSADFPLLTRFQDVRCMVAKGFFEERCNATFDILVTNLPGVKLTARPEPGVRHADTNNALMLACHL
ncbi:putative L-selectin [Trichinella spiralis]|uniref:putative L-selectin n=1 Tax=Trichinella spiralis TaxID=6334 RepID=UPI0001EFD582|nr:putative L-selectin [Trichinella spiralis]